MLWLGSAGETLATGLMPFESPQWQRSRRVWTHRCAPRQLSLLHGKLREPADSRERGMPDAKRRLRHLIGSARQLTVPTVVLAVCVARPSLCWEEESVQTTSTEFILQGSQNDQPNDSAHCIAYRVSQRENDWIFVDFSTMSEQPDARNPIQQEGAG